VSKCVSGASMHRDNRPYSPAPRDGPAGEKNPCSAQSCRNDAMITAVSCALGCLRGCFRFREFPGWGQLPDSERVIIELLGPTFSRVLVRYGFMQQPNLPQALAVARKLGWQFDIMSTSFFLSRRTLKPASGSSEMPRWQEHLYIGLARSANDATDHFQLPTGRVLK
jgi:hypothetical protein